MTPSNSCQSSGLPPAAAGRTNGAAAQVGHRQAVERIVRTGYLHVAFHANPIPPRTNQRLALGCTQVGQLPGSKGTTNPTGRPTGHGVVRDTRVDHRSVRRPILTVRGKDREATLPRTEIASTFHHQFEPQRAGLQSRDDSSRLRRSSPSGLWSRLDARGRGL